MAVRNRLESLSAIVRIRTQAETLAKNGFNPGLVNAFDHILNGFEANVKTFIETQGGIYEARFDNELEGNFGTIGAAINGIEQGLKTHNADLVTAGVEQLNMNNADVAGNNFALGGGTYTTTATTAAGAATGAVNTHLVPHGDNGIAQAITTPAAAAVGAANTDPVPHGDLVGLLQAMTGTADVAGNNAPMGGENGATAGAANTQPVPHGDLIGLLQAMSETPNVAGNNAPVGGGNGAAAGAVDTHLILQAMTGTADVAGNNAPMGGEIGAAAGVVDTHLVPHGGNGIDQSIGVDHLHHAQTETIGLFHG
jgi:hypothetical protein